MLSCIRGEFLSNHPYIGNAKPPYCLQGRLQRGVEKLFLEEADRVGEVAGRGGTGVQAVAQDGVDEEDDLLENLVHACVVLKSFLTRGVPTMWTAHPLFRV